MVLKSVQSAKVLITGKDIFMRTLSVTIKFVKNTEEGINDVLDALFTFRGEPCQMR